MWYSQHLRAGLCLALALLLLHPSAFAQLSPSWLEVGENLTARSLTVTVDGELFIVGQGAFQAGVGVGVQTFSGHSETSALLALLGPDNAVSWIKQGAFRGRMEEEAIGGDLLQGFLGAIDTGGNFYTSEGYPYSADAGMLAQGGVSINKYDPAGDPLWSIPIHPPVRQFGDQPAFVAGLGVDAAGNTYIAGNVRDTLLLAGDTLVATPSETMYPTSDVFMASFSPDGALRWSRRLGGAADSNQIVYSMAVDARDRVCVAGEFDGIYMRMGNRELRKADLQADKSDGFCGCYSAEGALLSTVHAAGTNWQRIRAIALGETGDLYIAGLFMDELSLGSGRLTRAGDASFFARFDAATVTSNERSETHPARGRLEVYPNPTRQRATIRYDLEVAGPVRLAIYDMLGRKVAVLVDAVRETGVHEAVFDAAGLPAGVYGYRLTAGGGIRSGMMFLNR